MGSLQRLKAKKMRGNITNSQQTLKKIDRGGGGGIVSKGEGGKFQKGKERRKFLGPGGGVSC